MQVTHMTVQYYKDFPTAWGTTQYNMPCYDTALLSFLPLRSQFD